MKTGLETYVITDNEYIAKTVNFNSKHNQDVIVIYDERDAESGTHRISNIVKTLPGDNFINVQEINPLSHLKQSWRCQIS